MLVSFGCCMQVGFKQTGRQCPKCGKPLFDQILDWEDALPKDDLKASEKHATEAVSSVVLLFCTASWPVDVVLLAP